MSQPENDNTFQAKVLRRGTAAYEAARLDAVWNQRKPDRFPAVIILAEDESDVVRAVLLARAEGLRIAIRSGGHSWVGNPVRDGGLLLDLSRLREIAVDADARIATVQPAAKGPALDAALAEHSLFFPTGHAPTVGIGGFILGGGYGWNSRRLGPACLSIKAIDVVLADGTLIHATDATHPDLLWAARGSGPGFFGIVTRFHLAVYERPSSIRRTAHTYPIELRDDVLAWAYDNLESLSPAVEFSAKVGWGAGGQQSNNPDEPTVTLTATAFCTPETGQDLLAPLEAAPFRDQALRAVVDAETTMPQLYDIADRLNPAGLRWAVDGVWLDGPARGILDAARPVFDAMPGGASFVLWMLWGHYPERADACWSAQAKAYLSPNSGWSDQAGDLEHEDWVHGSLGAVQHLSHGLQFSDNNLADRFDLGLSPENAERLEKVRAAYDPDGLFRSYMAPDESSTAYARSARSHRA